MYGVLCALIDTLDLDGLSYTINGNITRGWETITVTVQTANNPSLLKVNVVTEVMIVNQTPEDGDMFHTRNCLYYFLAGLMVY